MKSKFSSAEKILSTPEMSWRWILGAIFLAWIAGIALIRTDMGKQISYRLHDDYLFRVREYFGQAPGISPKMKVFVIDDVAFRRSKNWPLTMDTWVQILQEMASKKPRNIIIDSTFQRYSHISPSLEKTLAPMRELNVPIASAGYFQPKVSDDHALDPVRYLKPASHFLQGNNKIDLLPKANSQNFSLLGAHTDLRDVLSLYGNVRYEGNNRVFPFQIVDGSLVLPHLSFLASESLVLKDGELFADRKKVFTDRDYSITVNFPTISTFMKSIKRLPTENIKGNGQFDSIESGSTVVILPGFYSGSGDYHSTSVGHVTGGYIVASIINSILTGEWIKNLPNPYLLALLFCVLGALVAVYFSPLISSIAILSSMAAMVLASFFAFALLSLLIPMVPLMTCYLGASGILTVRKVIVRERKTKIIRYAFEGNVSGKQLSNILDNQAFDVQPRQEVATIMFIDMVGFSVAMEGSVPRRAFERLKNIIDEVTEVIHRYDGVVNKTIGDGVLAVFGLNKTLPTSTGNHALNALKCALEIQQLNVENVVKLSENKQRMYLLLRIGINTGPVFVGNLGKGERIDLTLIGNAVNTAKRLETDCSLFHVLVGESTHELVKIATIDSTECKQKFVRLKHHVDMLAAWEYNPFRLNPQLVEQAEAALSESRDHIDRRKRWQFFKDKSISVDTSLGKAHLINFSHSGLCLKVSSPMKEGQEMELFPESLQFGVRRRLEGLGIEKIIMEVKWQYHDEDGSVCGLEMKNLTDKQKNNFIVALCEIHDQLSYSDVG